MQTDDGHKVMFVQIAGLIARRIVTYPQVGDRIERGRRFGLIRFGSRVDIYLPPGSTVHARLGESHRGRRNGAGGTAVMKRLATGADQHENLRRGVFLLPNLLTTGGLFSGFYSIVATMNGNYLAAGWFILIAAIFDGLDGKVARLTGTTSKFGVEYDSLADLVAFGVAPGLMMYAWALKPFGKTGVAGGVSLRGLRCAAPGAFQRADHHGRIETLRRPADPGRGMDGGFAGHLLPPHGRRPARSRRSRCCCSSTCWPALMVSNIRYYAFKDPELFRRQPFGFLVLAIIFIIVIVAQPEIMIFALACVFVASGPIGTVLKRFRKPATTPQGPPPPA